MIGERRRRAPRDEIGWLTCATPNVFSSPRRGTPPLLLSSTRVRSRTIGRDRFRRAGDTTTTGVVALLLTTGACERDRDRQRDRAKKTCTVGTSYQSLRARRGRRRRSAAACAAAFARAALSISSRAIFLASMSSTLVGEGAAVAAREKSRGPSPTAATKARRDALWVAHREHAHDGVHCASPQDAQTTREGPEPGRLVAAMRVGPRVAELRRVVHRKGSEGESRGSDAARPRRVSRRLRR